MLKPKPRAFADGFRRIEGVKDQTRLADARAGVGEQNDHVSPSHNVRTVSVRRLLPPMHPRRYDDVKKTATLIRVAADRGNGSTVLQFRCECSSAKSPDAGVAPAE